MRKKFLRQSVYNKDFPAVTRLKAREKIELNIKDTGKIFALLHSTQ